MNCVQGEQPQDVPVAFSGSLPVPIICTVAHCKLGRASSSPTHSVEEWRTHHKASTLPLKMSWSIQEVAENRLPRPCGNTHFSFPVLLITFFLPHLPGQNALHACVWETTSCTGSWQNFLCFRRSQPGRVDDDDHCWCHQTTHWGSQPKQGCKLKQVSYAGLSSPIYFFLTSYMLSPPHP